MGGVTKGEILGFAGDQMPKSSEKKRDLFNRFTAGTSKVSQRVPLRNAVISTVCTYSQSHARNVRLRFLYRQYTNLFIFRFVYKPFYISILYFDLNIVYAAHYVYFTFLNLLLLLKLYLSLFEPI